MYSRRPKESHLDTVRYEIDMLDFSVQRVVQQPQARDEGDRNVYLECFFVHFRNLLRFFSGTNHRKNDLSTAEPEHWSPKQLTEAEIQALQRPARGLETRYFDQISAYIQHCTIERHENDIKWDVNGMYRELDVVIDEFERLFPRDQSVSPRRKLAQMIASGIETVRTQAIG